MIDKSLFCGNILDTALQRNVEQSNAKQRKALHRNAHGGFIPRATPLLSQ